MRKVLLIAVLMLTMLVAGSASATPVTECNTIEDVPECIDADFLNDYTFRWRVVDANGKTCASGGSGDGEVIFVVPTC